MYSFEPVNKLLLVEKLEEKKKVEHSFYVPETIIAAPQKNVIVKLIRASEGSQYLHHEGDLIVVQSHLLDTVQIGGDKWITVSESGVVGLLRKNEL